MSAGTLVVKVAANITDFSKGLDAAEKRLMKAGDNLERMGERLTLKVTAPLLALSGLLAKSAAEDAASVEKLGRTFGRSQASMEAFVQSLMKSVPETDDALRGMAASTGTLLANMGLAPAKAVAMSQTVLRLAGDFGAFNKELGVAGASSALDAALAGKTKGLAQFGVVVSEADIKAKAYQMGLAKTGEELTHAATAQAALAAVLERSQKIQGEAARTIGDNANAWARMKQASDSVADSFGAVVLPTFIRVMNAATGLAGTLAELPEGIKGGIVAAAALAAAWGPLVYLGGNVVKVVTLMRAGIMAVVSVQALSGLGALVAGVRSLADAMLVARLAGAAFATALAPLLVPAAIVAGIAAIGYAIWKSGESARTAAANLDAYKQKLATFTTAKQSQASAKAVAAQLRTLNTTPLALTGDPMQDAMAKVERDRQRQALTDQLRAANQRTFALTVPDTVIKPPPGGETLGVAEKALKELEDRANRLGAIFELTNAKGHPLALLNTKITATMDALSAALAKQSDQWGESALRIRQAMESLQRYGATSEQLRSRALIVNTPNRNQIPGRPMAAPQVDDPTLRSIHLGQPSAPAGGQMVGNVRVPNPAFVPVVIKTPQGLITQDQSGVQIQKQTTLQERIADNLAQLPDQFAQQLAGYLGPVLAKMGGGTGGAIGAALGGGIGGAIGKALVPENMGKLAGAVIGSVLPVVGTIVGSLAGNVLGGAIGKLFGHRSQINDAADETARQLAAMAEQARRVNEAISGLPQGIKLAAYRFTATEGANGAAPGGGSGRGERSESRGATGGFTFTGPITINGVTNIADFFRQLSAYAESTTARGGTTGLSLAAARG